MSAAVVLDNEAVQALMDVQHRKHRRVLAHLAAIAGAKRRGRVVTPLVPTAIRVKAGWDRTRPTAALIKRLQIRDATLDGSAADVAAAVADENRVSVADAHLAQVARHAATTGGVTVLTSDRADARTILAGHRVNVVII